MYPKWLKDKWYRDMSSYLLEMNLRVLDPKTRSLILKTRNYRASLARRYPETMAQESLRSTFGLLEKLTVWVRSNERWSTRRSYKKSGSRRRVQCEH